jgi:hypothetical protein
MGTPVPTVRSPAFKGSGMKLGSKRTKQAELLDALGGEAFVPEDAVAAAPSVTAPAVVELAARKDGRGSVPVVHAESIHIVIKEQISLTLLREGGLKSMELKGDMNLQISDAARAHIGLALAPPATDFGSALQFKQHPNVAKFTPGQERVIALKDPARAFPVGQSLAVLKWRYTGADETYVPLSVSCWPTPAPDGTCLVNIEYELENAQLVLHDVVISIPLPLGAYPTVTVHTGEWSLNPATHALAWAVPRVSAADSSGSLEFAVGGDDTGVFFPVRVSFVGQGSMAGLSVVSVSRVGDNEEAGTFSQDATVVAEDYLLV